jgi:hypothetical protein
MTDEADAKQQRLIEELAERFWKTNTTLPEQPTERQAVEAARNFLRENPSLWQAEATEADIDQEELAWSIGELWPGPGWKRAQTAQGA